jgi:hypothetical protein
LRTRCCSSSARTFFWSSRRSFSSTRVFLFDQGLHLLDRGLQDRHARGGGDRFGHDIGEGRKKNDILLVVIVLLVIVDLEHAIGLTIAFDDDVDGRDDAVLGIEVWQLETGILTQIIADRWFSGGESQPLRRALIGARDNMADDARVPAISGFD